MAGLSSSADPLSEPVRPKDADDPARSRVYDRVQVAGNEAASDQTLVSGHIEDAIRSFDRQSPRVAIEPELEPRRSHGG
jgi:hypothetical protein